MVPFDECPFIVSDTPNNRSAQFPKVRGDLFKTTLCEHNWDYARSRARLLAVVPTKHQASRRLYKSQPHSRLSLTTGCPELDSELQAVPLKEPEPLSSNFEHGCRDDLLECQCCFSEVSFFELCFCDESHAFCRQCLQRVVESIVYDQGSGLDHVHGSVLCISSVTDTPCTASIPLSYLSHFLPPRLLSALEDRFARYALDNAGVNLLQCPFCRYAVEDLAEVTVTENGQYMLSLFLQWVIPRSPTPHSSHSRERQQWESIFRCRNPSCGRSSCLLCHKEWIGFHNCVADTVSQKNAFVTAKMDETRKRTVSQIVPYDDPPMRS